MRPEVKRDTNRIAKVNSLIEHEMGKILLEFLYGQKALVTITKVETSRDMKWAKIWISIVGTEPSSALRAPSPRGGRGNTLTNGKKPLTLDDQILESLNKNIYDLQGQLNRSFHTKIIPKISFRLDTSPRYAQHIEDVIKQIHEDER